MFRWYRWTPTLIRQVFVNLFENVLRYTPQDSPIEIHARPRGGYAEIEVSDRGVLAFLKRNQRGSSNASTAGVPAKREDGGMGLGLTICRAIIEAHGGSISIANRDGGGAVVRFTLPLAPEKRPSTPP